MIKATDKKGFFLFKTVNTKMFFRLSPVHKVGKFKIFFFDCMKPWLKNVGDEKGAAENEINFKYCHHLFFFFSEKNRPNQMRPWKYLYCHYPSNRKKLGRPWSTFWDICLFPKVLILSTHLLHSGKLLKFKSYRSCLQCLHIVFLSVR